MPKQWTGESVLEVARSFQPACVLLAAAELEIFDLLAAKPMTAEELAGALHGDARATTVLADALTALGFLIKKDGRYHPAPGANEALTTSSQTTVLPMLHHQANLVRSWAELARVVKTGLPAERPPSVRGEEGDLSAFIEAMDVTSRAAAPKVVAALQPLEFNHILDIGCGPGTWSIAFLRATPNSRATLYDLPEVIPIARKHVEAAGLSSHVEFVGGDFDTDEALPQGADLAWVSAIIHMNSREKNRKLFAKAHAALAARGRIMIRDIVMDDSHTSPPGGAMFAVNMLVRTKRGGTYSLSELSEDLQHTGFGEPSLVRGERDMDSVAWAPKRLRPTS
jgi:precorrin-6B methylase 2